VSDFDESSKAAEDQLARTIRTTGASGAQLNDEQQKSVDAHSRSLAEQLNRDNVTAAPDQEQAAGGYVRAGKKTTGVDPITDDAFAADPIAPTAIEAVTLNPDAKPDVQRQGEEENERTLAQQRQQAAARKSTPPKSTRTP
jgi:hypothetical protein